ncbi:MAG: flagellin lysine-N-methylase, partial [Selenomonadaceae bacterium]|nr:flagellin lysine-N-methylase [Selenomonadaceae bacterium]
FVKERPCPFLTEKKLCRLQLECGEIFLPETCVTYPRRTLDFGQFLERSLVMSCPLAAELILFRDEPIKFEFVEVSEQVHSRGGKLKISPVYAGQKFAAHMLELQIAMISILQERTLTIDQRLIVLGFFMDRLDEIEPSDDEALTKLIAAYESKKFLSEQAPRMSASVHFDAKKFSSLMLKIFRSLYADFDFGNHKRIFEMVSETFGIDFNAKGQISVEKFDVNYERLAETRKNFEARRALLLENFLVNELFVNCYPWRYDIGIAKNFGLFVVTYKIFELMIFMAEQQNLADKKNLSLFTGCFLSLMNHTEPFAKNILSFIPDDIFDSLEMLLEPQAILDTKGAVL